MYQDSKVGDIVNVKDRGARGDGHSEDTAISNSILLENAKAEQITYFPHGYYVVTDTIYVPPNSRIIGEVWSAINGAYDPFVFLCKFGTHLTNRFFQLGATISQMRTTRAQSSKSGNQARLGLPRFPTCSLRLARSYPAPSSSSSICSLPTKVPSACGTPLSAWAVPPALATW